MNRIALFAAFLLPFAILTGCSEEDTNVSGAPGFGSIDKTTYVAIGNSLTAGYQSGGVIETTQRYSFANLIAGQLGTSFSYPIIPAPGTGSLMSISSMNPLNIATAAPAVTYPVNATHPAPYNNLGIPGAVLADAIDTSSILQRAMQRGNPFYLLVMRDQAAFGASLVQQAARLNPTLLTFWLGNNDVLGYAASGGTRGSNIGIQGNPPGTLPTEVPVFSTLYQQAVDAIRQLMPNAKVIVATIPDVTVLPLMTTVPRAIPNPQNPSQLLPLYYKKNDGQVAQVGQDDYVLLTAQAWIGLGYGLNPNMPLESQYVLDASEAAITTKAVSDFNAVIRSEGARAGFAVVDFYDFFNRIHRDGYKVAGLEFTTAYISGGLFSLDGVHPSSRGSGIIANEFIRTMNVRYGANIPFVDITRIPGIPVPAGTSPKLALLPATPVTGLEAMVRLLHR